MRVVPSAYEQLDELNELKESYSEVGADMICYQMVII